jgi:hypothetical protein
MKRARLTGDVWLRAVANMTTPADALKTKGRMCRLNRIR